MTFYQVWPSSHWSWSLCVFNKGIVTIDYNNIYGWWTKMLRLNFKKGEDDYSFGVRSSKFLNLMLMSMLVCTSYVTRQTNYFMWINHCTYGELFIDFNMKITLYPIGIENLDHNFLYVKVVYSLQFAKMDNHLDMSYVMNNMAIFFLGHKRFIILKWKHIFNTLLGLLVLPCVTMGRYISTLLKL
jgi:hypothetical protein